MVDRFLPKERSASASQIQTSNSTVSVGKTYSTTKTIIPTVLETKSDIKHSTTVSNYFDTQDRQTIGINHNVRIGKDYYISAGITRRDGPFYSNPDYGVTTSITKYW
jgi:hypothetical protein